MKTIKNEIKAKVFAQYLGCNTNQGLMQNIGIFHEILESDIKLILKPLSDITNEDMIWVYDTCRNLHEQRELYPRDVAENTPSFEDMKHDLLANFWTGFVSNTWAYQYLLSQGYDLPQILLGYKTLFESGLAIYEK